jgi:hypothetical protein
MEPDSIQQRALAWPQMRTPGGTGCADTVSGRRGAVCRGSRERRSPASLEATFGAIGIRSDHFVVDIVDTVYSEFGPHSLGGG